MPSRTYTLWSQINGDVKHIMKVGTSHKEAVTILNGFQKQWEKVFGVDNVKRTHHKLEAEMIDGKTISIYFEKETQ